MSRTILVLGTSHGVQGSPFFHDSIDDPAYLQEVETVVSRESVDFIFEEASSCGETAAQRFCKTRRNLRYLDIDPHRTVAHHYGIVDSSGQPFPDAIDPLQLVEEQNLREGLWSNKILSEHFTSGLLICGYLHTLSMEFRLRDAGLVAQYWQYLPHAKLGVQISVGGKPADSGTG